VVVGEATVKCRSVEQNLSAGKLSYQDNIAAEIIYEHLTGHSSDSRAKKDPLAYQPLFDVRTRQLLDIISTPKLNDMPAIHVAENTLHCSSVESSAAFN